MSEARASCARTCPFLIGDHRGRRLSRGTSNMATVSKKRFDSGHHYKRCRGPMEISCCGVDYMLDKVHSMALFLLRKHV